MVGDGGIAHFQFLLVRVLASDDPNAKIDFYATRNTPWTKESPERVDLESSHILPMLTRDTDRSEQAQGFEISSAVV
jgi:hypothetical protein